MPKEELNKMLEHVPTDKRMNILSHQGSQHEDEVELRSATNSISSEGSPKENQFESVY